jgi:hypothetical protein
MSHRLAVCLAVLSFAAGIATAGYAQDSSSAPPAAQASGASAQTAQATPPVTAPAAKKVWTNEDVTDLRENSAISTVGGASAKSTKAGDRQVTPRHGNAQTYRDQIAKLQAQLTPIDAKIAQLQAAIDGTPQGDSRTSTRPAGVRGGDWRTELAELQSRRDGIAAHIAALRDEARHNGIPDNQLP